MPTYALVTSGGSTLGLFDLSDDEAREGAIIRRPGEPDRRVIGLLDDDEAPALHEILIFERICNA